MIPIDGSSEWLVAMHATPDKLKRPSAVSGNLVWDVGREARGQKLLFVNPYKRDPSREL